MIDSTDALLDGVIERNGVCLRQLLALLRPQCLRQLRSRLGREIPDAADILAETESLLYEWSVDKEPRRRLPRGEPLYKLAWRLVNEVLRQRSRREARHQKLTQEVATSADFAKEAEPAAMGFGVERIARLILALPPLDRDLLTAEVSYQLGEGPPAAAALSLGRHAAQCRISRARVKLLRALHEQGYLDDDPEKPDG